MRLGDLDALKRSFIDNDVDDFGLIDNAPTVEYLYTPRQMQDAYLKGKAARQQVEWIPVSERLPEERIDHNTKDFEYVLCSTIWDDVRPYKFGKPIGHDKPHFWLCGGIMDEYVIAWRPLPEPYKKEGESDADS